MERRDAIKNIGLTFGAVIATPGMLSLLQSCGPNEIPWTPTFFTEEEGKVVRKLVDVYLPAVENLPSATQVNVHVFIDKYIKDVMEFEERKMNRESLGIVIKNMLTKAGKEKVEDLKTDDYESFLTANLKKNKQEEEAAYEVLGKHMSENDGDATGLDEKVRTFVFLAGLREAAIWAYRTNERVGETIMAYKPVPGEQRGCVDLEETTGGMAWSL